MTTPEALRLAEQLETFNPNTFQCAAAAELRRLHSVNAELLATLKGVVECDQCSWTMCEDDDDVVAARAIIAKAEGRA